MSSAASSTAAIIAAQKALQDRDEEENMTKYNDKGKFEYKILRSATNSFKDSSIFKKVLDEESENGWELVEKFDNARIRLRRPTNMRSIKDNSVIDPYRSYYGVSDTKMGLIFIILMFVFTFIVLLISGL